MLFVCQTSIQRKLTLADWKYGKIQYTPSGNPPQIKSTNIKNAKNECNGVKDEKNLFLAQ
jgi:hypothetical protein